MILECGHPPTETAHGGTGYGYDKDHNRHCYECCHQQDIATLAEENTFCAYVSLDKMQITNWPGYKLMRVVNHWNRRNNFAGKLLHIIAIDAHGREWYGDGPGDGMYINLHKSKVAA